MSILSKPAILLIRAYQKYISPLTPPRCKYYPTCSSYAIEAYKQHGLIMGTVLTSWRLMRCNPWSLGGVDYVPEKVRIDYFRIKRNNKKM